jgi:hypothetical protein
MINLSISVFVASNFITVSHFFKGHVCRFIVVFWCLLFPCQNIKEVFCLGAFFYCFDFFGTIPFLDKCVFSPGNNA